MSPLDFAQSVMAYCYAVGGSVTSWGRTTKRNALVGGHPDSKHMDWLGADVVPDDPNDPNELRRHRIATQLGIKLVIESDHDHLQAY